MGEGKHLTSSDLEEGEAGLEGIIPSSVGFNVLYGVNKRGYPALGCIQSDP